MIEIICDPDGMDTVRVTDVWGWHNLEFIIGGVEELDRYPTCPYNQFPQDRDHNAAQNVLREAPLLIGHPS
ncbi:hypothetical protein KSX_03750 [Ktedonospora formicarum]|uniref:Uncharacterized protein n=1 Tax=Ktedonospora formicarum TaxID=2778364 RepID=A0A8J3HQZ1_9CHLR|nr:hypothetical protein KSX_03750 [Ktedonospora formicarum]